MDWVRYVLVLLVLYLLITASAIRFQWQPQLTGMLVITASIVVFGIWLVGRPSPREDDSRIHNVWDAIPFWQYEGRHIESGGLARHEQERAIQEIERQARDMEESQQRDGPEEKSP